MFSKHIDAYTLYKKILKAYPNFVELDHDTISDLYRKESPIVLAKIYSIHYLLYNKKEGQLDDISPLSFLLSLGALADNNPDFENLDILAIDPADLLYGLYEYTLIMDEKPRKELLRLIALMLIYGGIYKVTLKPLEYINNYIHMEASDNLKYRIEHEEFTGIEQSAIARTATNLYNMIRRT